MGCPLFWSKSFEIHWIKSKNDSSNLLFTPRCLALSPTPVRDHKHSYPQPQKRKRWGLSDLCSEGQQVQPGHLSSCRMAWIRPCLCLRSAHITEQHLVWQSWRRKVKKKHLKESLTVRWTANNRDKQRIWDLSSLSLKLPEKMPRETSLPSTCSFTSIKGRFAVTALRAPFQKNARNLNLTVLWNPHN